MSICLSSDKKETVKELNYFNIENLCQNPFLAEEKPVLPEKLLFKKDEKKNWFDDDQSGILKDFRNTDFMTKFLKFHANIHRICVFYIICGQLYELANVGGDLGVYGEAAQKVIAAIEKFEIIIDETYKIADEFLNAAIQVRDNSNSSNSSRKNKVLDSTVNIERWTKNFFANIQYAADNLKEIKEGNFNKNILTIKNKIIEVKDNQYLKKVTLIKHLVSNLVDQFVGEGKNNIQKNFSENEKIKSSEKNISVSNSGNMSFFSQKPTEINNSNENTISLYKEDLNKTSKELDELKNSFSIKHPILDKTIWLTSGSLLTITLYLLSRFFSSGSNSRSFGPK